MYRASNVLLASLAVFLFTNIGRGDDVEEGTLYQVGVAAIDVTPHQPIRLRGYSGRNQESNGVVQRLWAKALAIKSPKREVALLITLDNCLIPGYLRSELAARLRMKTGLHPDRFAITATHTHNGPMLARMSETLYCHPLPAQHKKHIEEYTKELIGKLEDVGRRAIQNQQPARLYWAIGEVGFAKNRRKQGGPVDHDLPSLFVKDEEGNIRAVYVSYACHCTTLSHNKISGDWAGYAQELIQGGIPKSIALVSAGCGADANPVRGTGAQDTTAAQHGQAIAAEVMRLSQTPLTPIAGELDARLSLVDLQLAKIPTRAEWMERAKTGAERGGTVGFHAKIHLERLDRGEAIKTRVPLPVQTWTFSEDLAMVFLGGEVVAEYSLRLKKELDRKRIWINSYANDVPCYVPSEKVLQQGGYEGGGAMTFHDWASPFLPGLERRIVDEVHYHLGNSFRPKP
ncbi:MAG: neutral/alkaline non-lysosomal ceramidase N-terminal domain-containing protein [Planctomycetes bacterium]|nr:neutral/alkaline non-lysosomal ceramidase N-terminal domain-containing protein [Planctomycetota bacterium]